MKVTYDILNLPLTNPDNVVSLDFNQSGKMIVGIDQAGCMVATTVDVKDSDNLSTKVKYCKMFSDEDRKFLNLHVKVLGIDPNGVLYPIALRLL